MRGGGGGGGMNFGGISSAGAPIGLRPEFYSSGVAEKFAPFLGPYPKLWRTPLKTGLTGS